jgi:hypothetical protein
MLGSLNIRGIGHLSAHALISSRSGKFALIGAGAPAFQRGLERSFDFVEGGKQMKLHSKLVTSLAVLAMGLLPATAGAVSYQPDYHPDHPPHPTTAPKGHAYGYYCKGVSKKHVKGEKGTPFSKCVRAMRQADHDATVKAKKACKGLSKKHVKGQKGTEFSRCVKGVAQMRKEKAATVTASAIA